MKSKDLEFLDGASSSDLQVLVDYITRDKKGSTRLTEGLTITSEYKKYYPHSLNRMTDMIINELECYGGNTFVNFIRGGGVGYRTILTDVAKKMKVNFNPKSSVELIEQNILQKVFVSSLEEMSDDELKKIMAELDIRTTDYSKQAMIGLIQIAIKKGGFAAYRIAVIVANAIARFLLGRGLSFAANAALTRAISIFAGPIGWIFTGVWTAIDVAGPAYRVTIPAVIQIAYMRAKSRYMLQN